MFGMTWKQHVIGLGAIALIIIAIVFVIRDSNAKQECFDSGGQVVEYNCHYVTHSCGSGCFTTTRSCNWRCAR